MVGREKVFISRSPAYFVAVGMRKDGAPKKREEKGGPFLFFYQVYTKVLKIYTIKKKLFVRFLSIRPKLVLIKLLPRQWNLDFTCILVKVKIRAYPCSPF